MQTLHTPASSQGVRIRWAHRDIPLSYGRHRTGRVAWSPQPQSIAVESQLESEVLSTLMHHGHLLAVHSQPFTVSFLDGDTPRVYTPDFLVVYDRLSRRLLKWGFARWTVIEVKPASYRDRHRASIECRLQAVRDCLGLAAVCLTEADLPTGRA